MKPIPIFGTEERVPPTIGGLRHSTTQSFDDAALGVALRYEAPDEVKGDVYLFNPGMDKIPDDMQSPEIRERFEQECAGLVHLAQSGIYQDFAFVLTDVMPFPDDPSQIMYHVAGFRFRRGSGPLCVSHLALRTDRNFFTKVRYTYPHCTGQAEAERIGYFGLFLFELYDKIRDA